MTTVLYEPEEFRLRIEGHAGSAPKGGDLVCAAVSALAWTLAGAAQEFRAGILIDEAKAIVDVRCRPEAEARVRCRCLFDIIAGGLALIAQQNPEHLRIVNRDRGESAADNPDVFEAALPLQKHLEASQTSPRADQAKLVPVS